MLDEIEEIVFSISTYLCGSNSPKSSFKEWKRILKRMRRVKIDLCEYIIFMNRLTTCFHFIVESLPILI